MQPGQAAVGGSNAVGVATEIGEHLLGAGERTFGVDHPLDATQAVEAPGKRRGLGECGKRAGEAQYSP